ncbi:hypothetical protein L3Q82_023733 [Scortum barcoo]|uniref:Uncharacterized protein n=1 Tax=Scortum barcoo TaxID=214431 RepID=A0ACB8WTP1_9TELE|nr:hypothetical protein L3Q82_023733 [Scortum barcoo]
MNPAGYPSEAVPLQGRYHGQPGQPGQPEYPGQPGQPGQPGYPGQPGQPILSLDSLGHLHWFISIKVPKGTQDHLGQWEYLGQLVHLELEVNQGNLLFFIGDVGLVRMPGPPGMLGLPGPAGDVINYDFVRRVGQKYFVSYKERGSFSTAVDFCSQRGLELALPQNEEENSVLTQVFGDVHKTAWINVNNNKAEGNFEADLKNRPLTFTKWGEGQPDRSIQDTGCTMLSENGIWRVTRECSLDAYIVFQI